MNALARAYELGYWICHYDYACLSDPGYVSELSWKKKILCKKEYWTEEMRSVLEGTSQGKILSTRGKTTTEKILVNGQGMIVKRERAKRGLFCIGRGIAIWNNAHRAKAKKIPTVTPVAMWETKDESKVVYLCEGTDLKNVTKKENITHVAKLIKKLRFHKAIHHDFRLKNVLLLENSDLKLIDIDKLHFYPRFSLLYHFRFQREMVKFKKDWNRKTSLPLKLYQEDKRTLWHSLMLLLAKFYENIYAIIHYDYVGIDHDYFKKLGFKEKFLCMQEYHDDALKAFALPGEVLHKRTNRITKKIEIDGKKYILKRERSKGFLRNLFFMTRGVKIWNNAHIAKVLGFPVLTPVAMMEERGLREVESAVLYLMEGSSSGHKVIEPLVASMKHLHLIHHDFRAKNLVVLPDHTLQCIDIDHLHRYPKVSYVFQERLDDELEKFHYQEGLVE